MMRVQRIVRSFALMGLAGCVCGGWPARGGNIQAVTSQATTVESRVITVRIDRPFDKVYEYLVDPANWNQWSFGLGKNIRRSGEGWVADSDGGVSTVQFTPRNKFGVVDHTVVRPNGQRVYVPMRLIGNGSGCELQFTLFREAGMPDARFASDAGFVQRDLNGLKKLMEQ